MQRVVHVSLGGNAYALEEGGHEALRAYLDEAARQLGTDPDQAEILADLEGAIGEKCARHLGPHKTVVTAGELRQVLDEMGPVRPATAGAEAWAAAPATGPSGDAAAASAPAPGTASPGVAAPADAVAPPARRLYRVLEGGVLGGICAGLGAYFTVDANIVRAIFVVLALVTHGAWALVYLVLLFVLPAAGTAEERAAARGLPFSAQQLVDEAKRHYARLEGELRDGLDRKRRRKRERKAWRREARARGWRSWRSWDAPWPAATPPAPPSYGQQVAAGLAIPVLAAVSAALTVLWLAASAMLVTTGAVFGWSPGLPLWAGLLLLLVAASALGQPFHRARKALHREPTLRSAFLATWDGLLWVGFLALFTWLAWTHVPALRELVADLGGAAAKVRDSLPTGTR